MAHDALALPLLEFMQHRAGCLCLSDLQSIADWLRRAAGGDGPGRP